MAKLAYPVDDNMVHLVKVLNTFSGLSTFSSCGGHDNPTPGQCAKGTWSVSLDVDRSAAGWEALDLLTWAAWQFEGGKVIAWPNDYEPGCLAFSLEGRGDATPDLLAALLLERRPGRGGRRRRGKRHRG